MKIERESSEYRMGEWDGIQALVQVHKQYRLSEVTNPGQYSYMNTSEFCLKLYFCQGNFAE